MGGKVAKMEVGVGVKVGVGGAYVAVKVGVKVEVGGALIQFNRASLASVRVAVSVCGRPRDEGPIDAG